MVFPTPSDRARDAARAYDLARARGDDRLRRAAIADYRDAMRELRADLSRLDEIRRDLRAAAL
jgi:hypothetical protein